MRSSSCWAPMTWRRTHAPFTARTGSAGQERRCGAASQPSATRWRLPSWCSETARRSTPARSTGSSQHGETAPGHALAPPTAACGSIPCSSLVTRGTRSPTPACARCRPRWCPATTSTLQETSILPINSGMAVPRSRMTTSMELVESLEPNGEESALARARLHRQLTVEEMAKRSGLSVEEVRWLEEARVYRFARPDDALAATILYASALGIDNREARELAGMPLPPAPVERDPRPRLVAIGGIVVALAVFAILLVVPRSGGKHQTAASD